jgi:hypothetical protein
MDTNLLCFHISTIILWELVVTWNFRCFLYTIDLAKTIHNTKFCKLQSWNYIKHQSTHHTQVINCVISSSLKSLSTSKSSTSCFDMSAHKKKVVYWTIICRTCQNIKISYVLKTRKDELERSFKYINRSQGLCWLSKVLHLHDFENKLYNL